MATHAPPVPRVDLSASTAAVVLRARIWCDTNLAAGTWSLDARGVFAFDRDEDAVMFRLAWQGDR